MSGLDVVLAPEVIVAGLSRVGPSAIAFPAMPPKTTAPPVDAIAAFTSSDGDFCWILTSEIVEQVGTALMTDATHGWEFEQTEQALDLICRIADSSGGGNVDPAPITNPYAEIGTAAAQRAAAAPLNSPRILVTGDPGFRVEGRWTPEGVPWSDTDEIVLQVAVEFRDLVHAARWQYRSNP